MEDRSDAHHEDRIAQAHRAGLTVELHVDAAQLAQCLAYAERMAEAQSILHRLLQARTIGAPDDETPLLILVALVETAVILDAATATQRLVGPLEMVCSSSKASRYGGRQPLSRFAAEGRTPPGSLCARGFDRL
jgi:hypothetical protein